MAEKFLRVEMAKRREFGVTVTVGRLYRSANEPFGAVACVARKGSSWGSRSSRRVSDRCGKGSGKSVTAATKTALRALANSL